jgi:hypothetical protein
LQITGWVPSQQIVGPDGNIVEYSGDEIVCSPNSEVNDVFQWCAEQNVDADMLWVGRRANGVMSEWGIKDEVQRTMFALRWI